MKVFFKILFFSAVFFLSCDTKVYYFASGVSLDKMEVDILAGGEAELSAAVHPSNANDKSVSWKSDNPKISVDQSGKIFAKKDANEGDRAKITATTNDGGYCAVCVVTVISEDETFFEYAERIGRPRALFLEQYKGTLSKGEYAAFGFFPQSVKKAEVEIDENSKCEWAQKECFKGSDFAWYAKKKAEAVGGSSQDVFSDGEKIESGEEYYFKVEPVVWRRLSSEKDIYLSEKILRANVAFYPHGVKFNFADSDEKKIDSVECENREKGGEKIYSNNYEHSRIRAYLNGISYLKKDGGESGQIENDEFLNCGFLQSAFTEGQRKKIKKEKVFNDSDSTKDNYEGDEPLKAAEEYASGDTEDEIFLASTHEITSEEFGFDEYQIGKSKSSRIRAATDYALANFAVQFTPSGWGGLWWLRSPAAVYGKNGEEAFLEKGKGAFVRIVNHDGSAKKVSGTSEEFRHVGIVPAIRLEIEE